MKFLIIYSHPESVGFCAHFLGEVKDNLTSKKVDFEVIDLYKINYDPILKLDELYTAGNRNVSFENQQFQQKIKDSDGLIFIYPVWWGGMPAILKGFIDRVFIPGFAFKYRKDKFFKFIPDKFLDDKKISIFVSSGSPWFVYKIFFDPIKFFNKFFVFGVFCSNSKTYQIYGSGRLDEYKKSKIRKVTEIGIHRMLQ